MTLLRRTTLTAALAACAVLVAALPVGAGDSQPEAVILTVAVTGADPCNTTTGQYDITWTITKTNSVTIPVTIQTATMTPPGSLLTVTPNPIPGDPTTFQSGTATASLPGNTVGPVNLIVTGGGLPAPTTGTVTVDGTCAVAAVAVAAAVDFTG